jgi:hypothetical protein
MISNMNFNSFMKRILLALTFLGGTQTILGQQEFTMPTALDYPSLPKTAARPADFIPAGWKIMGEAEGDLNGDKKKDSVLVIRAAQEKFLNKNEGLGGDIFDTNPRILAVLFWENDRYQLAVQSNSFIVMADSPTMEEPFQEVNIVKGILEFNFQIFMNAGGWGMSNHLYKFRYQKGAFALIGADRNDIQRNTGESEDRSYNFLTGKVQITTGNISGKPKDKTRSKTYRSKTLKTFETFPKPFEWEVEKDYFL